MRYHQYDLSFNLGNQTSLKGDLWNLPHELYKLQDRCQAAGHRISSLPELQRKSGTSTSTETISQTSACNVPYIEGIKRATRKISGGGEDQ
jgi:hypothetical protein